MRSTSWPMRDSAPRGRPSTGSTRRGRKRTSSTSSFTRRADPIGDEHFARATELEVSAHRTLVASIDDVLVTKLLAINEQEPDFRAVLEISRAVREQVNWASVARRTSDSPFARAFFELAEGLAIVDLDASTRWIARVRPATRPCESPAPRAASRVLR